MAKELNEDTSFKVSIKTLGGIAAAIATIVGMWFALQADIEEARHQLNCPLEEYNPVLCLTIRWKVTSVLLR